MRINHVAEREYGPLYLAIDEVGFSVTGFARRMGVARTTVWRIDRGLISPTDEWWEQAATLLGVSVSSIRRRSGRRVAA